MTKDKTILIRNIYYMLSYAFSELKKNNYEHIAKEEFDHIQDLFAEILYKGVSAQLKRGLHRKYVERQGKSFGSERAVGYKRDNHESDALPKQVEL